MWIFGFRTILEEVRVQKSEDLIYGGQKKKETEIEFFFFSIVNNTREKEEKKERREKGGKRTLRLTCFNTHNT